MPPPREVNAGCEQMTTQYRELVEILQTVGKDPSRLIFEDELTGLNNRRFLLSFFEHKVQWDMETDFPLSLLMLDLDHFKQVNDTHGHEAGDQVLLWLSSLMQEISGDEHFPIRYGGDEFMLLVQGAEADEARMLADLLLQRTRTRPFQLRGTADPLPITLSIGVACAPRDASDGDGLIHKADAALYHAKNTGRNRAASAHEVGTEPRFRIIEVLDVVTRRVKDELGYCLGDSSAKVRQAAYQLAERIGDPSLVEVVAPHAQSSDLDVSQPAIRCLANLGSEEAAQTLVRVLKSPKGADHAVACAQALGQFADPVAVDALATVLLRKKHWFGGWKWDDHVRATAAMALRAIGGTDLDNVLFRADADPEPRIREVPAATDSRRAAA